MAYNPSAVTRTGTLDAFKVVVGNGTADLKVIASAGTAGDVLTSNGGASDPSFQAAGAAGVTSVAMTGDGVIFNSSVTGSPITTSGTLIPSLKTETANAVLAGPTTGAAATPTFRALVTADMPAGTGTVTAAASLTNNAVVLGAGSQAAATNTAFTTDGTKELDIGVAGGGNGVLGLNGTTSGTATITAPAVAGTSTNPLVFSNVVSLPNGTTAGPSILMNDVGFYRSTTTTVRMEFGGTDRLLFNSSSVQPVVAHGMNFGAAGAPFAASFFDGVTLSSSANGASVAYQSISELITLSTVGLTTDSVANLLPANSVIDGVTARITTTITTTTSWALGDAATATRFASVNATLTSGTTTVGLNQWDPTLATATASGPTQAAAAKLRITCIGANPGAGVIRVIVFYHQFTPPTS